MNFLLKTTAALFAVVLVFNYCVIQTLSAECNNWERPVLNANYTPMGKIVMSAGMDTYETGNPNSSKILIAVFDIYGLTSGPNIMQVKSG
jgi:hypothetical protein